MFHFAGTVLNNTQLEQVYYIYIITVQKPQQSVSSYRIVRWLLILMEFACLGSSGSGKKFLFK